MCLFAGQFKICYEESNWFLGEGDCICPFTLLNDTLYDIYGWLWLHFFFYKKPRVMGSGSTFLQNPEFESQKFKFIKFQYLVS